MIGSVVAEVSPPSNSIHGASKASPHLLSDTLRIELAAFDVSVLMVVTGAVAANLSHYKEDWKLPDGSLYDLIASEFASHHHGNNADDVDVWAGWDAGDQGAGGDERQDVVGQVDDGHVVHFLWHASMVRI